MAGVQSSAAASAVSNCCAPSKFAECIRRAVDRRCGCRCACISELQVSSQIRIPSRYEHAPELPGTRGRGFCDIANSHMAARARPPAPGGSGRCMQLHYSTASAGYPGALATSGTSYVYAHYPTIRSSGCNATGRRARPWRSMVRRRSIARGRSITATQNCSPPGKRTLL